MFQRDERIVALLQEELSTLIRSVKDPGVAGLVTLTGVELSGDRKTASVYFSVFGNQQQRDSTAKALARAAEYIRYQLKGRLSLKIIPRLEFLYDNTPERAQRIEEIFGKISAENKPPPKPSPPLKPARKRKAPPA